MNANTTVKSNYKGVHHSFEELLSAYQLDPVPTMQSMVGMQHDKPLD
ncbi:MAG: hypothetical protein ACI9XJ_000649 [Marivirga sp.]|jgi:hypothetical protein